MADLAASNITVAMIPGYDVDTAPDGRVGQIAYATLTFGNGVLTYPAGGIPMPAPGKFNKNRLVPYRWVDFRKPIAATANVDYRYDPTVTPNAPYGAIRIIILSTGAELGHVAVAATILGAKVQGS